MIESIEVTNHQDESILLELRSPEKSGFFIKKIDGLGPPKADINMTEMAGFDGGVYNSSRAAVRNIVLELGFLQRIVSEGPSISVEDVRQLSYKYFPLKRIIKIQVNADNRRAKVWAYVESNEPDIFSSEEGCVVSLLCENSYLLSEFENITPFSSVTSLFEFPWSNESLVAPLLEMSELDLQTLKSVIYEGDAEIGFLIHIHATGAANNVTITDAETLSTIDIESNEIISITGSDIIAGDDIWISTVKGDKYAILIRGVTEYNILSALGEDPFWFTLDKGDNLFAYSADSGIGNLQFEIINDVAFEGI
jgi:hypothetical protein